MARNIVLESFEQVGLWPWNPDRVRELCQIHCPPPSPLNLRTENGNWEQLMNEIRVEREAERDDIIALGELMIAESYEDDPRYAFRVSTKHISLDSDVEWRQYVHDKLKERGQMQPHKKRQRRMKSTRKPL